MIWKFLIAATVAVIGVIGGVWIENLRTQCRASAPTPFVSGTVGNPAEIVNTTSACKYSVCAIGSNAPTIDGSPNLQIQYSREGGDKGPSTQTTALYGSCVVIEASAIKVSTDSPSGRVAVTGTFSVQ